MNEYQSQSQQSTHPGEILNDMLEDFSLSQVGLSKRLGISEKHISNLINGKTSLTKEMSQKLSLVFGTSTDFWLNLQKNYDAISTRIDLENQFIQEKDLLKEYSSYKQICDWGYSVYSKKPFEKYVNLLNFFGVAKLSLVPSNYEVAFRNVATKSHLSSVASWLRCGEIDFNKSSVSTEFNYVKFRDSLTFIRSLTRENPGKAFQELQRICADSGVTLVYTPYFKNTGLKGATRWIQGRPLIQLSEMHKKADAVWFSFFHEAAHIILMHSRKKDLIDWKDSIHLKDSLEKEADEYARDLLIEPVAISTILKQPVLTNSDIEKYSRMLGVGSDIVAGRLMYEKKISPQQASIFARKIGISNSQSQ